MLVANGIKVVERTIEVALRARDEGGVGLSS